MNDDNSSDTGSYIPESETQIAAFRKALEDRCAAANLPLKEIEDDTGDKYLFVELPAGREKRPCVLWSSEDITSLLSVPFEKYVFLQPYEAICSYSDGTIEALLQSLERMPSNMLRRLLLGKKAEDIKDDEDIDITHAITKGPMVVTLSRASENLQVLIRRVNKYSLSLKISGISVKQHDDAVALLKRIANSLLFQIDSSLGVAISLVRERMGFNYRGKRRRTVASLNELPFPTQEYDDAPMSLFWYARSAQGMPLLQFLAYYQVIEFYFPTYYQAEAKRKIQRILKDPTFRADRDADIGRVLSSLISGRGSIGDERSMMRATMQECVSPDELRGFLTETKQRAEFFSSKTKGLVSSKIPIANTTADLRSDVADRMYEIRCKIVHTKSDSRDGEVELLLPFSREADLLYYDVELVKYLAKQVLITASTPLAI